MRNTPRLADNTGTTFDTLTSLVTKPEQQLDEGKNKTLILRESLYFRAGSRR